MSDVKRRGRPSQGAREALVASARRLFTERDYADVSTDDVLSAANVSRGALYHHFPGKLELFLAAYEASEAENMMRVAARTAPAESLFGALRNGCLAYLDECAENRELQRIGLRQSRAVLGWDGWREAAGRHGLGMMRAGVGAVIDAGELAPLDVDAVTSLLLSALIEAGVMIAAAEDPAAQRRAVEPVVDALLEGLRS